MKPVISWEGFPGVEEHRMIDKDFIDHLEEQIHQTVQDALYLKETVVRTVREKRRCP